MVTYLTRLQGFTAQDARTRAERALDRVGLTHAMDRPVQGYSKGMRQRMKLAQALTHDPDVLVLDEPMNGLDPVARRDMAQLIREIGEAGSAVVVSSHVLHEVESMTRRVLLLDHGRVIADGTIEEIRKDLGDRPLAVHIECADVRGLARRLVALDGLRRIDLGSDTVEVLTVKPGELFRELVRLSSEDALQIRGYQPTDESLEAVFRYLTT
jgi:ABC-2 type transport system ATP-binding protein